MKPKSLRLVLLCIALLAVGFYVVSQTGFKRSSSQVLKQEETGEATIGGEFVLIDQAGKERNSTEFRGKYLIVYFGYTFCPDVCPMGLHSLTQALKELNFPEGKVQPLFITVDPERDTPGELAKFCRQFSSSLICLTGNKAQIESIMKGYHVYAARKESEYAKEHYLIDHSSIFYIMSPTGKFLGHFTHSTPVEMMKTYLTQWIQ